MPDDLLRHVIGPLEYSAWWCWLATALSTAVIAWYAGVLLVTSGRTSGLGPLVRAVRDRSARHRSARAVREIGNRYRDGELEAAQAGFATSRVVRRFLHRVSGIPAEYMQVPQFADSALGDAATLMIELGDVQFNDASRVDVVAVIEDAEELIRSWT